MRLMNILGAGLALWPMAGLADEAEDAFVEANLIGIFYHEMGHAMIDLLQLPVFGQEEDAADVASIFLIDQLWEPDAALDLAYEASFGFAAEAMDDTDVEEIAFWDVHGPDPQRFYNTVCLFYGADPDGRDDFAADMELPEERAEYCEEEYAMAADSWGAVLNDLSEAEGEPMRFEIPAEKSFTADVIANEVEALNADFSWPETLTVLVEDCGEANAFYDPQRAEIVMCSEFAPNLRELYRQMPE